MPRIPAHLRERALDMLQRGMTTADVARAINCNVRIVRRLRQRYRETGRTADSPRSGRPCVTTLAQDRCIRSSHLRDRYRMKQQLPKLHQERTIPPSVLRLSAIGWTEGLKACCSKAGPHQTSPATTPPMGTNPPSLAQTGLAKSALH